jgi:hypothetical protein
MTPAATCVLLTATGRRFIQLVAAAIVRGGAMRLRAQPPSG